MPPPSINPGRPWQSRELDPSTRARLEARRGRSPHDFVPGIPVERDWRHWLDAQFTRREGDGDLNALWDGPNGPVAVLASRLGWDTDFFGFAVARLDAVLPIEADAYSEDRDVTGLMREVLQDAIGRGVQYLFAIVDSRDASLCRALPDCGFQLLETRVTFHRSLTDFEPPERHPVREANAEDIPALQRVATEMVNPLDRFHADPCIPAALADRLMAKWVEASVVGAFADFVLVPDEPEPGAFVTVRTHEESWKPQGVALAQPVVLGAVLPRLRGWYLRLLTESCRSLRDRGAKHAFVVTQSGNRAAVKTFEKAGFSVGKTELVFRWTERPHR